MGQQTTGTTTPARPRARKAATAPRGLTTKQWLSRRLADVASWLATTLPLSVGYWLASRAGDLFYQFATGYRGNVIDNLRHVLGPAATQTELEHLAHQTFRYSAMNFYDLVRLKRLSIEQILKQVVMLDSWEVVDREIAKGKGGIFVTGHMGAFDFAGQVIPHHRYKAVLVTVRTVSEFIHEGVTYLRASQGFGVEEATPGGLRRLMRALRRGDTIGLATDRDFLRNGQTVQFFGEETTLPIGAVRLALETGAPILPILCRRHRHHHTMVFDTPFYMEKTGNLDADLQRGLQQLVEVFERQIRADPAQWVMFQRVWPATPPPALSVFPVGSPLEGRVLGGPASSQANEPRLRHS